MHDPLALDADLSVRLHAAVLAGPLRAALDDPATHTVVIALRPGAAPGASLLRVLRAEDRLERWIDLSCI